MCYFLPLLFSCYSAFPHPPTLAQEEPLPNDVLAYLPWQELRNQQEGNKGIWESQVGLSSNHISWASRRGKALCQRTHELSEWENSRDTHGRQINLLTKKTSSQSPLLQILKRRSTNVCDVSRKRFSHMLSKNLLQLTYLENLKTWMFESRNDCLVFFSSSPSLFNFSLNELRTGQYDGAVLTLLTDFCQLLKLRRKISIDCPIENTRTKYHTNFC